MWRAIRPAITSSLSGRPIDDVDAAIATRVTTPTTASPTTTTRDSGRSAAVPPATEANWLPLVIAGDDERKPVRPWGVVRVGVRLGSTCPGRRQPARR